jgi:1-hydroxycarotenoid 3,4-desaturase
MFDTAFGAVNAALAGHHVTAARIAIVGSGIGGLAAAVRLASAGLAVTVYERAARPGGKLREIDVGGAQIDSGPTVFTMRDVLDELFDEAGASFADAVTLRPLDVLARHVWTGGRGFDLFADPSRSADAIGDFAGRQEAKGYLAFAERARRIFETLERSYIRSPRPTLPDLVVRVGAHRFGALAGISPFTTLWRALGEHFADPRLRQLFARYATYCGSSPFLAPATLMLVSHVERQGVWAVEGGMYRIVEALVRLAESLGVRFHYGAEVREIRADRAGATGLVLASREVVEADAVVANADVGTFAAGLFGPAVARAAPPVAAKDRSLSALTWSLVAETEGVAPAHHTVFFSDDYEAEFDAIRGGRPPADPTVYVCAPDRGSDGAPSGPERLFCIVNAPANGDRSPIDATEASSCETRTFRRLERCGLTVRHRPESSVVTTPSDFAHLFPGTGGALYGRASHGWTASFQRPGSRSRIPRLYLAGGSTHPGPGVPMAAISGILAAESLVSDLASTSTSRRAGTRGGMSMR